MVRSKLEEAITEAEARAARAEAEATTARRLVDDLKAALARATNGGAYVIKPRLPIRHREPKSTLLTAIDILSEQHQPMHIKDLVELVTKRRGQDTVRASLESVLSTAIKEKKFGLKRPDPGMYEVER